jgi:DNA-binding transcriptional LysR family regulator
MIVTVADAGGFARTAGRLQLSRPAASRTAYERS